MYRYNEDAFDDIEAEGYDNYISEDYSTDYEENDELEYDDKKEPLTESGLSDDWHINGLSKTYSDSKFDLHRAEALFYAFNNDGAEFNVDSQIEAVRYANFYARNRDKDAQNFIIGIVQRREEVDPAVAEIATNSFALFIRNYLRKVVESHYSNLPMTIAEKTEYIRDAVNECFLDILATIKNYDPVKSHGHITSYFSSQTLQGSIQTFEAHRRGRPSKQTQRPDIKVAKAIKQLQDKGEIPSVQRISLITGMKCESIRNAKARITAENAMGTLDTVEVANLTSEEFDTPEAQFLAEEKRQQLFERLKELTPEEFKAFLALERFELVNDELIELDDTLTEQEIAESIDMSTEQLKYLHNIALRKLRKAYNRHEKNRNLLKGRTIAFIDEKTENFEAFDDVVEMYF